MTREHVLELAVLIRVSVRSTANVIVVLDPLFIAIFRDTLSLFALYNHTSIAKHVLLLHISRISCTPPGPRPYRGTKLTEILTLDAFLHFKFRRNVSRNL